MFAGTFRKARLLCYSANEKLPVAGNQRGERRGRDGRGARRGATHRIVQQHARRWHDARPGIIETRTEKCAIAYFFDGAA